MKNVTWQDRAHFLAIAARVIRRILVDAGRIRASLKRGGPLARVNHASAIDFDQFPGADSNRAAELCALDDALNTLLQMDARRAQVIELPFLWRTLRRGDGGGSEGIAADRDARLENRKSVVGARAAALNHPPGFASSRSSAGANARDHERQIVGLRRSAVSLHRLHDRIEELGRRAAVSRPQNLEKPRLAEFLCLSIEGLDDAVGEHHERVLTRQRDVDRVRALTRASTKVRYRAGSWR